MTAPLSPDEIAERLPQREPEGDVAITIERRFHVVADREPGTRVRLEPVERPGGGQGWEVVVEIDGVRAGARAVASPLRGDAIRPGQLDVDEDTLAAMLDAFVPAHLGFDPVPREVVDSRVTIRPRRATAASPRPSSATTIGASSATPPTRGRPSGWCRRTAAPDPA